MENMRPMPRDKGFDHTLDLLREGYLFISSRCRRYGTDVFQTRFLGIKVICMSGEEAARLFYDDDKFQRKGAIPKRLQKTMVGEHTVQTLDSAAHRHRKQLLLSLVDAGHLQRLSDIAREEWLGTVSSWEQQEQIVLFTEARKIFYRVACRWTGVPLQDVADMAEAFSDLVAALGAFAGPRYREGKRSRRKVDRWLVSLVKQVRSGELQTDEELALARIARHRDLDGKLLDSRIAAAELNNFLHTVTSAAIYVAFGALALHEHPRCREQLLGGGMSIDWFIQEVRRFYPFGPFIGAKVHRSFVWRTYTFPKGTRTLLDIYGTNRDPRLWEEPDVFRPERFQDWHGGIFAFIPHGGGEALGHRCAGEQATMELLRAAFTVLLHHITYAVSPQNTGFSLSRMPTVPRDGLILQQVKMTAQ
ncbi:cytochrome P450 [Ectobacillus ponti]|uniref:Cytochrome P450 n=1 Tax=Ectobacillus ponti TaxID=2961894 RepID=A0AA41X8F7_9BACI|nr:cytochrome P450 [Ectobacillus ponti]MCP8968280.1 cytochrome P450 [Ectobacillus ponti]